MPYLLDYLPSSQNPLFYWKGAFDFSLLADKGLMKSGKFGRFVFVNDLHDLTEEEIGDKITQSIPEEAGLFVMVPYTSPQDGAPPVYKIIFQSGYEVDYYYHTSLAKFIQQYASTVLSRITTVYMRSAANPFVCGVIPRQHLRSIEWILSNDKTQLFDRRYMQDPVKFPKELRMDPVAITDF